MQNTKESTKAAPLKPIEALKVQLGPNSVSEDQQDRMKKLTDACLELGKVILAVSKPCPDQTVALRKLRELKYTLTSAIASEEFL